MGFNRERLFHISGLLPLLTVPWLGTTWLIYTALAVLHRFKERIWQLYGGRGSLAKYLAVGMASAYFTEVLAIIDNLNKPPAERALFNSDPLIDLYLAFAYYIPFILYWGLAVRRYDYSWKEVFMIGGTTGILMEQSGAVFLSMNPLAWIYVLLVYGSYKAVPVLVAEDCLEGKRRRVLDKWKKLALGLFVEFTAFLSAGALLWLFKLVAEIR
ncbi:hypothetical protein [Thermococcus sp.]|uniref:hypothetical protein n=1 Tax=Thermococcus sp. TaxID=35749 RepID=UPI002619C576|nr:hypothetical protein [Thermococcus sp.]